jgi:hypothetical protein
VLKHKIHFFFEIVPTKQKMEFCRPFQRRIAAYTLHSMVAAEGGRSLDLGSALNAISLSPNKSHAFVVGRDGMSSPAFKLSLYFHIFLFIFSFATSP